MLANREPSWLLLGLVAAALPLCAQPLQVFDHPSEAYLGADTCGSCHAAQFASQSATGHALSLAPVANHALAALFAPDGPLARAGGASYSYRDDDDLHVEVAVGEERLSLQLEWAFGAGEQAVTFVGHADEKRYVEHHFSYYAATDSLATTPGHRDVPARGIEDALGVYYQTFGPEPAIMRCFQCHSTGPLGLGDDGFSLQPRELGIRCEACHGPGRRHVEAIASGNLEQARAAVGNPGRLQGGELLQFCGACHRPPASSGEVIDWSDPWNVRHQPVYLSRSACVQPGGQAVACMRCHDPHQPLSREAARDDGRCLDCHTDRTPPAPTCRQAPGLACASCHMPSVEPQDNLRFTNHWIGIYDQDMPLRPREARPR